MVAKNNLSHEDLSNQFNKHNIDRIYQLLIWGKLRPSSGKINTLITRSKKNRQLMEVGISKGKKAITNYKTLHIFENENVPTLSLVECKLETGRTHQIRVHMSHKGNNIVGDKKAVACIEDTAVPVEQLADYIEEFTSLMKQYDQNPVYYAHAGAGELHLRPLLNLKKQNGVDQFKAITTAVAHLVKKFKGSMSGEHGDGIVRSEFISFMLGNSNYELVKEVKQIFDPFSIFNPGKIVNSLPMDQNLRYQPERKEPDIDTFMDFNADQGILRAVEKCNGSGDCRNTTTDATICPSYRATKDEKDSTRGCLLYTSDAADE